MISRQAVTHIPLSNYAFANSESNLTIRIKVAKNNLTRCILHYGDRVHPTDPIVFTPLEMQKVASDLLFDIYDATFESPYTRVCYYFELIDADERVFLFADIFSENIPKERSEFYQYPFMRREEISTVPEWLKHAVVYNIFPDSFASGKRTIRATPSEMPWENGLVLKSKLGGTVRGITENLDYIADMGFNCLYINPIFIAGEYHKYDLLDYKHIAPNMGTDEDFRELVTTAHEKGIRVVIDGVFNHCSWYFFAFDDVVRNGEKSVYKDWFYDLKFPVIRPASQDEKPTYSSFAYERKMPKLNSSNPEVRNYFLSVCEHWIKEYHVDGWRLDVANEVDRDFWRAFKKTGRALDPDSIMIGEIWESSESWLQGDMFDSTMNYDFRKNCRDFFGTEEINVKEFDARVTQMNYRYPTGILHGQLNLLDSHDVNRFFSYCRDDIRRLRLAEVFLFTAPGVPCVFYGDELGMNGNREETLRGPMPWNDPVYDERAFFKSLISLRKDNDTLIYGTYHTLSATDDGLYMFERRYGDTIITVALNARDKAVKLENRPQTKPALSNDVKDDVIGPFGYAIWKETTEC